MVKIEIEMDDQGRVSFNGPLGNKVLCYGLLQVAADIVRNAKMPESQIAVVGAIPGLKPS